MNIETYRQRHEALRYQATLYRHRCFTCLQPEFACYCQWIKQLDPKIEFVILTHPIEIKRRRIATGRMAHMSLQHSHFVMGSLFCDDARVNAILADVNRHCVMLYPGRRSANLSEMSPDGIRYLVPAEKKLTVFVIDGTWSTAKKTVNQSSNLNTLPRICFTPPKPSNFRVRQQPRADYYSTIEAIHHTIELLGSAVGFDLQARAHDQLLFVFSQMVEKQLLLANSGKPSRRRGFP